MRRSAARFDDDVELLEPLPVDDEPDAHRIVAAVLATIDQATLARSLPPWSETPTPVPPSISAGSFLAAFSRMVALPPPQLAALGDWWFENERDGRVEIARRLVIGEPRAEASGGWRVPARLRSPGRLRCLPVEIVLWPRLDAWTKLNVEPQSRVRIGRRYFRSGHRVLDELCDRLVRELRAQH